MLFNDGLRCSREQRGRHRRTSATAGRRPVRRPGSPTASSTTGPAPTSSPRPWAAPRAPAANGSTRSRTSSSCGWSSDCWTPAYPCRTSVGRGRTPARPRRRGPGRRHAVLRRHHRLRVHVARGGRRPAAGWAGRLRHRRRRSHPRAHRRTRRVPRRARRRRPGPVGRRRARPAPAGPHRRLTETHLAPRAPFAAAERPLVRLLSRIVSLLTCGRASICASGPLWAVHCLLGESCRAPQAGEDLPKAVSRRPLLAPPVTSQVLVPSQQWSTLPRARGKAPFSGLVALTERTEPAGVVRRSAKSAPGATRPRRCWPPSGFFRVAWVDACVPKGVRRPDAAGPAARRGTRLRCWALLRGTRADANEVYTSMIGMGYHDASPRRSSSATCSRTRPGTPPTRPTRPRSPGPARGAAQLPDDGRRPHRSAGGQRLAARRGHGRGRGDDPGPPGRPRRADAVFVVDARTRSASGRSVGHPSTGRRRAGGCPAARRGSRAPPGSAGACRRRRRRPRPPSAPAGAADQRHRLGGRGRLVEHGGAGDRQPGEVGDHRLEVEQRLEPALADLGLVGRVGGVPGGFSSTLRWITGGVTVP